MTERPDRHSFGAALTAEMTRTGMTAFELAVETGITPVTITRLRGGKNPPTLDTFKRILRVLPGLAKYIYSDEDETAGATRTASKGGKPNVTRRAPKRA
jgi:transcriptional regulator with XRE-family HTH domain